MRLWGEDHDFTLEEMLSEISYFRGESYHTIHNCGEPDSPEGCISTNFSEYAKLVRSPCEDTLDNCQWNDQPFDCCKYFQPMETELGICYALNSIQIKFEHVSVLFKCSFFKLFKFIFSARNPPKLNMLSNKHTGPGKLNFEVLTDSNVRKDIFKQSVDSAHAYFTLIFRFIHLARRKYRIWLHQNQIF